MSTGNTAAHCSNGGSGNDPLRLSQNLGSIFGKLLRIDPLGTNSANRKYGIPSSNPFVRTSGARFGKAVRGVSSDAAAILLAYDWPGNVRELENAIERAILLADAPEVTAADLRLGDSAPSGAPREGSSLVKIPPTGIPLEEIERLALVEALKMSNWVQKDAAELLAISPRVMNYKIKILNIEIPRSRRIFAEAVPM